MAAEQGRDEQVFRVVERGSPRNKGSAEPRSVGFAVDLDEKFPRITLVGGVGPETAPLQVRPSL